MALTGNKIDLILGLKLTEFFRQSKRVQLEYKKTKGGIEKHPIKVKEIGTQNMLKRLTQIGIAYIGLRKISDDFRKSQTNLANVASLGVDNIVELGEGINKIAADVPVALHDIEAGLYDVVSAGVAASDQIDVLDQSARAAAAGLATTKDSLDLGSAVIKGYGKKWSEFDEIMDKAFQTVKLGQTTFPELAANMGKVIPLASALNVDVNDLFGAMATLTGVTGNAAEVATQLRGVLAATAKPTGELTELFKKYGGAQEALRQLGLPAYLKAMADATGGNADQMIKLVPRVEALNATLALGTKQYDAFVIKSDAMAKSTGVSAEALAKQSDTLDAKLIRLDNTFQLFTASLLTGFVPAITDLLEAAGDLFKWFAELDTATQKTVITFTALGVILLKLPVIIRAVRTAVYALNASLGPAGWLILGIGAAATAWGLYAEETDKATKANLDHAVSLDILNAKKLGDLRRDLERAGLEELIKKRELYNKTLNATIKNLDRLRKDPEGMTFGLEDRIKFYNMALRAIDELIVKRKEFEAGLKPEKQKAYMFEIFKPGDIEGLTADLGDAELKFMEFYGNIGTVATEFYDLRAEEVEREYNLRNNLLEHYMSELLRTHSEGSIAYQELIRNKLALDRSYFQAKKTMEENAVRVTLQLGAQLMGVFQGQSQAMFSMGKALAIANLLVTKSEAMARAFKDYPWPLNIGIALLQGALVAGQIAQVYNVQYKPKGKARGGEITKDDVYGYPYIPSGEDGIIAAQIGETIMNRRATRMFRPMLEEMNARGLHGFQGGGTVNRNDIKVLGEFDTNENYGMLGAIIADAIKSGIDASEISIVGNLVVRGRDLKYSLDKTDSLKVGL